MANTGYEIDDTYAEEQQFIKIYFDFDTTEEAEAFAEWADENWWRFQAVIDEFENGRSEHDDD